MTEHNISHWQHPHHFSGSNPDGERNTFYVLILT